MEKFLRKKTVSIPVLLISILIAILGGGFKSVNMVKNKLNNAYSKGDEFSAESYSNTMISKATSITALAQKYQIDTSILDQTMMQFKNHAKPFDLNTLKATTESIYKEICTKATQEDEKSVNDAYAIFLSACYSITHLYYFKDSFSHYESLHNSPVRFYVDISDGLDIPIFIPEAPQ